MKKIIFVLLTLAGFSAVADSTGPIVVKSSGSGYTPLEYAHSEVCEVFADKVIIKKYYGRDPSAVVMSRTVEVQIDGDLQQVVAKAAQEKVTETNNGMCDGPFTSVSAPGLGSAPALALYSTGGCGTPKKVRSGPYSYRLKNIVDTFCPKTY